MGQVSLGHAAFLAVGAYVYALLAALGTPALLALPMAAGAAGLLGLGAGQVALRLRGATGALATLGLLVAVEQLLTHGGPLTGGAMGRPVPATHALPFALAAALGVGLALRRLDAGPVGLAWAALRDAPRAAAAAAVPAARLRVLTLAAGAAITGLAGGLMAAHLRLVHPGQFSMGTSLELLVMVVVGGAGRVRGPLLGAAGVVGLEAALASHPLAVRALLGAALLAAALLAPHGLAGARRPAASS